MSYMSLRELDPEFATWEVSLGRDPKRRPGVSTHGERLSFEFGGVVNVY